MVPLFFTRITFPAKAGPFIRSALIFSITGMPASAYFHLPACIGSLMVLHHDRWFSRRTPRPVGRRSLLPCSGRQLSGKTADSYYSSSSSFSYYFINYTDSIKISQVSNSISCTIQTSLNQKNRNIISFPPSSRFFYKRLSSFFQNLYIRFLCFF